VALPPSVIVVPIAPVLPPLRLTVNVAVPASSDTF
jgi:hypothetical protein